MAVGPEIPMKKKVGPCQCTVSEFPFAMKIRGGCSMLGGGPSSKLPFRIRTSQ